MNYLRAIADQIRAEVPPEQLPGQNVTLLFDLYAALALCCGVETSPRDVHNAWVVWMLARGENHAAMVPFEDLPPATQAEDVPFAEAIRNVTLALRARKGWDSST